MMNSATPRIPTFTGRWFTPLDPRVEDVEIIDIAHALANECRFTGHTKRFYSVAQHSVLVSSIAARAAQAKECGKSYIQTVALWGLLHDAAEAYLRDFSRPLKHGWAGVGAAYRAVENRIMDAVCDKFELPHAMPAEVREADERLGTTEWRDLMKPPAVESGYYAEPLPAAIVPWRPAEAKGRFLMCFDAIARGWFHNGEAICVTPKRLGEAFAWDLVEMETIERCAWTTVVDVITTAINEALARCLKAEELI